LIAKLIAGLLTGLNPPIQRKNSPVPHPRRLKRQLGGIAASSAVASLCALIKSFQPLAGDGVDPITEERCSRNAV